MSWVSAILGLLKALPKIIDGLREVFWRWEASRDLKKEEDIDEQVKKEHDDLRNGNVPRRD